MNGVCPVYLHLVLLGGLQVVDHVYPFNNQDFSFQFYLAPDIAYYSSWPRVYLAYIQRTAECPG